MFHGKVTGLYRFLLTLELMNSVRDNENVANLIAFIKYKRCSIYHSLIRVTTSFSFALLIVLR